MSLDRRKLENVKERADGGYDARCPSCSKIGKDTDGNNLRVWADDGYKCICGCDTKEIFAMAGEVKLSRNGHAPSPPAKPSASKIRRIDKIPDHVIEGGEKASFVCSYQYDDEQGKPLYAVARFAFPSDSNKTKTFRQYPVVEGGYLTGEGCMKGITLVPFRLPLIGGAETVIVAEGERDVETLEALGYVATCNPGGAEKWRKEWSHYFEGKNIVVFPDNDDPGRRHAEQVEAALKPVAKSFKRIEIPSPAKDITDFLEGMSDTEAQTAIRELLAKAEIVAKESLCLDWIDFNAQQEALPDALEIVKGMIRRGEKASLGGSSKSKKTFTGLDLVLSVASGKPWMGIETAKVPVVIVDMELRKKTLQLRIKKILEVRGITLHRGELYIISLRGKVTTPEKTLAYVKANSPKDAGLFFIDPFYKLNSGRDENAAGDITFVMNLIDDLGREFDAAILYSAHYSKGNQAGKESIDRISGSGVYGRDADTIISMTAHKEPECFAIEPIFRSFAPMEPWVVRWNYPLMERVDGLDPSDLKKVGGRPESCTKEELLELLPKPMSYSEWFDAAETIGCTKTTFNRKRVELVEAGLIAQTPGTRLWVKTEVKSEVPKP